MGTRELLRYLEKLEIGLSDFSYEELGTVEAGLLKQSFNNFKNGLEAKVFGVTEAKQLEVIFEQVGIQGAPEIPQQENLDLTKEQETLLDLISQLENTQLSKEQMQIVGTIKQTTLQIDQSSKLQEGDTITPLNERNVESFFTADKVDLKPILDECMGQMELLDELIRLYKQNMVEFIGELKVGLQVENFRGIEFACQKAVPSLRMIKTNSLQEIAEQMVTVCNTDNDLKHLNFLYNQLLVEYPKVEELIDFEMDVLRNM